jgi:2-polyprenyl-3-methyl-5-hydroxy-6-metoxy-1,4-benzoquinol methylase
MTVPSPAPIAVARPCGACASLKTLPYAQVRDVEYFTSDRQFTYILCENCSVVSLSNPPVDQLAVIYPTNYYSFQPADKNLGLRIKDALDRRLFRRCLNQLPNRPLAVMDVGGGNGHQLTLIRNLDSRVRKTVVVDLDTSAESLARAAGHDYFHGRIEDYQPQTQFDLILALNLIEHVANPLEVLTKLRDCLSDDGMVLIKTPNIDSLDHRLFRHKNWGGFHCPRHWVLFNRESFMAMAAKAGLRANFFAYTQGAPFWAVSILATLQQRKCIHLDASHPAYRHPLYRVLTLFFAMFDFLRRPFAKTSQMFVILVRT